MNVKDIMRDDPLSDELFFGKRKKDKDKKKKKKKKKDKAKLKGKKGMARAIIELNDMSKSELRDRMVQLDIDSANVDTDSKKSMREAIRKSIDPSYVPNASKPASLTPALPKPLEPTVYEGVPPFYHDEKSGDFVIKDAMDAPDMTCYQAMESLGAMRRMKRADDGFGLMMDKLSRKIINEAKRIEQGEGGDPPAIEAEFTVEDA